MYLKDKLIKSLKIKNIIFMIIGVFNVIVSVSIIASLVSYYSDNLETALHAKAMPSSIAYLIISIILITIVCISRSLIGDASFYSSYFEGNLDGYIKYSDLADVMGKSEKRVKTQLNFFRKIYMKNYELKSIDGVEQVVLNSKKCTCQCNNCGALIEKKVYFTGICPYCRSSDLFAKVLTDNRFYSIENNMSDGLKKPEFYSSGHLSTRKKLFPLFLCLALAITIISIMACLDNITNYNDKDYLRKVLLSGESYSSYELIKKEIMESIIWDFVIAVVFTPIVYSICKKIKYVFVADDCSKYFSETETPFINAEDLTVINKKSDKKRIIKSVRGAIRKRYLKNCTFEKHSGVLKIALAKKIVKDKCPSCGAGIVGAVDEHYKCEYCGNIIMDVIRKK
ncbi:MAG: hypothetical protein K2G63_07535 [Oscillospiraceae bacterium]|nr:hypothetical protein [Oscillospiraceae bacterium]